MSKSRKVVRCTFCGERESRAREDIIPKWLARELGGQGPFILDYAYSPDGLKITKRWSRHRGSAAVYKYPDVCSKCNNEWLSQIEADARPHLLPMIRGQQHRLDADAQAAVSIWIYKTALLLDAWHDQDRRIPAESGTRPFRTSGYPTLQTQVLLGTLNTVKKGVEIPHARSHQRHPSTGAHELEILSTGFAFRRLVLIVKIVFRKAHYRDVEFQVPFDNGEVIQIWPHSNNASWPTSTAFDRNAFAGLIWATQFRWW